MTRARLKEAARRNASLREGCPEVRDARESVVRHVGQQDQLEGFEGAVRGISQENFSDAMVIGRGDLHTVNVGQIS